MHDNCFVVFHYSYNLYKVAEAKNVQNFVAPVSPNSAKLVKIGKTPIKLQYGKHSGNRK